MRILSLFDGISCGQLALTRAGIPIEIYYASEIDKYAMQVTQKNFPKTIQLGDVSKIDFTKFIGKIDMIIGGSPCQDLSIAKANRQGLQGQRSGLFYKFVEAIRTIKPKYFLLENVASMSKESRDIITKELGVEPIMINSALVSAQQRKRLYWCNWKVEQPENKGILLKDILEYGNTNRKKAKTIRVGGAKSGWKNKHEWDMPNEDRVYTTIELERLQNIPDNYTKDIPENKRRIAICNAWTVNIITHILKELKRTLSELKAWHVTEKRWPEKVIRILPEGIFEIIRMKKRGMQNCKLCYFGQTNNGIHHCPNNIRCSFDDGTAIIFKKVGENTMNDKKKPEPTDTNGIIKRITEAIESLIKRQDTISQRITTIEERLNKIENSRH